VPETFGRFLVEAHNIDIHIDNLPYITMVSEPVNDHPPPKTISFSDPEGAFKRLKEVEQVIRPDLCERLYDIVMR
jgi:hypothetical protein